MEAGGRPGVATPNPVSNLQGVPVSNTAPTGGQILTLVNGVWTPTTSPEAPGLFYSTSSQTWVGPPGYVTTTYAAPENDLFFCPFMNGPLSFTVGEMAVYVTAAGGTGLTIALGIYADTGAYHPGSQVLSAGSISVGTSTGLQSITGLSTVLAANTMYWLGCVQQNSASVATLRATEPIMCQFNSTFVYQGFYFETGVSGALPASVTNTALSKNNEGPVVLLHT
jgi:hypothetical protein